MCSACIRPREPGLHACSCSPRPPLCPLGFANVWFSSAPPYLPVASALHMGGLAGKAPRSVSLSGSTPRPLVASAHTHARKLRPSVESNLPTPAAEERSPSQGHATMCNMLPPEALFTPVDGVRGARLRLHCGVHTPAASWCRLSTCWRLPILSACLCCLPTSPLRHSRHVHHGVAGPPLAAPGSGFCMA